VNDSARPRGAALTQHLLVEVIGADDWATLEAELRYDAADPYAVTLAFPLEDGDITWTFGRDLLLDGLYEPTGMGDVHLRPCLDSEVHAVVIIELQSFGMEALVQVRLSDLHPFVERTTALVSPGTESAYVDVDAAVAAILVAHPID
jgi:hypothetical protein